MSVLTGVMWRCLVGGVAAAVYAGASATPALAQRRATSQSAPVVRAVTGLTSTASFLWVANAGRPQSPMPFRRGSDSSTTAVRAETKGEEIAIVRVPVPAAVRLDAVMTLRSATYKVTVGRHVQLLGAASGRIDPSRDSMLVVAFRVSRRAPAGRSLAGTAEFTVGTVTSTVAIELDVPPRRQLTLSMEARSLLATRGRWTTMPLRVINGGNIEERAALDVGLPRGWRADVRAASKVQRVAAGQSLPLSLRLFIPAQANSGLVMLPVRLVRPGERDTTEQLQVDVIADYARENSGPAVTTSMISGRTADRQTVTAYALDISGNLSDSTSMTGRLSYAGALALSGTRGLLLSRSGMLTGAPTLDIRNPSLHLQAGSALVTQAELAGYNLAGVGGALDIQRKSLSLRAFDLQPLGNVMTASFLPVGRGRMQGVEAGLVQPGYRLSAFGSQLEDAFSKRTLLAYGVRAGIGAAGGAQFLSELAYRDAGHQRGLGASAVFVRTGQRSFIEARVLHAPGGSAGFARATDDISLSASRSVGTHGFVALNGWTQRDANPMLGALKNGGWSLAPSFDMSRIGTLGVDIRGTRFHSTLEGTRIGSEEVSAGGMWSRNVVGTSFVARSTLARIDRDLADSLWSTRSRQWRLDHSVSLLRGSSRGTVQANWTYQQFSAIAGSFPAQQSMHVRAERIRPRLSLPLSFEGDVQRMQVGVTGPVYWSTRAAATLDLRMGLSVTVAAERNPFMNMMMGSRGTPMAYTIRVDRTNMLPRMFTGARNQIFRDDNGNGRRDRHERGVGGIVIRCGARQVQTDAEGRFHCADREQLIDARTVPVGLLASSMKITVGEPVALRILQPVRVALEVASTDSLRLRKAMLTDAVVYARDTTGMTWYARSDTSGTFILDALPTGRYMVGVDASALEEPLSMATAEPVVEVGGNAHTDLVTIAMRARPIRVKTFDSSSPGSVPTAAPAPVPTRRLRKAPRSVREQNSVSARPRAQ